LLLRGVLDGTAMGDVTIGHVGHLLLGALPCSVHQV
jgi:hypothetical protein